MKDSKIEMIKSNIFKAGWIGKIACPTGQAGGDLDWGELKIA